MWASTTTVNVTVPLTAAATGYETVTKIIADGDMAIFPLAQAAEFRAGQVQQDGKTCKL